MSGHARLPPNWGFVSDARLRRQKTALGWHSCASRQWDANQLRRQSLQCSWTLSLDYLPTDLRQLDLSYSCFS